MQYLIVGCSICIQVAETSVEEKGRNLRRCEQMVAFHLFPLRLLLLRERKQRTSLRCISLTHSLTLRWRDGFAARYETPVERRQCM